MVSVLSLSSSGPVHTLHGSGRTPPFSSYVSACTSSTWHEKSVLPNCCRDDVHLREMLRSKVPGARFRHDHVKRSPLGWAPTSMQRVLMKGNWGPGCGSVVQYPPSMPVPPSAPACPSVVSSTQEANTRLIGAQELQARLGSTARAFGSYQRKGKNVDTTIGLTM